MNHEIHTTQRVAASVIPIVGNNDTEGTGVGVDLQGFESAEVCFFFGDSGDTLSGSTYVTPTVQESDDDSTYSTVASSDLKGTLTAVDAPTEDQVIQRAGYIGTKRYIRAFFDFTGTHTSGIPIAAWVNLAHARTAPVDNP